MFSINKTLNFLFNIYIVLIAISLILLICLRPFTENEIVKSIFNKAGIFMSTFGVAFVIITMILAVYYRLKR